MLCFFFQQTPFGQIRYSIIGDDMAISLFSIDEQTGRIAVVGDLTQTNVEEYRVMHLYFVLGHSTSKNSIYQLPLGKFSRCQINDIFRIFPRKQDLTFHANCLQWRQWRQFA